MFEIVRYVKSSYFSSSAHSVCRCQRCRRCTQCRTAISPVRVGTPLGSAEGRRPRMPRRHDMRTALMEMQTVRTGGPPTVVKVTAVSGTPVLVPLTTPLYLAGIKVDANAGYFTLAEFLNGMEHAISPVYADCLQMNFSQTGLYSVQLYQTDNSFVFAEYLAVFASWIGGVSSTS
ncbi:hypothetical protein MAR_029491, partial [Mya arenaria]